MSIVNESGVTKAVIVREEKKDFFGLSTTELMPEATKIANVLSDVVERQKLYTLLNGNKHIRVEGWQTLGTLLGILPKEKRVVEHKDGSFEAEVELVNVVTGVVVGGASSYCGMDEKNWASKPKYARRSMAITRATGKAYKGAFGWIVTLKGYATTPAEEMDGIEINQGKRPAPKPDPIFRMENDDDCLKLKTYLEGLQIPEESWGAISAALDGKPKKEISKITADILRSTNAQ